MEIWDITITYNEQLKIVFEPLIKSLIFSICFIIIFITFLQNNSISTPTTFRLVLLPFKNWFYLHFVLVIIYLSYASFIIFAVVAKNPIFRQLINFVWNSNIKSSFTYWTESRFYLHLNIEFYLFTFWQMFLCSAFHWN